MTKYVIMYVSIKAEIMSLKNTHVLLQSVLYSIYNNYHNNYGKKC